MALQSDHSPRSDSPGPCGRPTPPASGRSWGDRESLALLRAVKFLGDQLPVPGQNGVQRDTAGHLLQRLLAQFFPDLGEGFPLTITQAYAAFDLRAQETILCHQILVPQEELLVH